MWAVKLGGSLWRDQRLPLWLDVLAGSGAGKTVLVPGGGPFADQVRTAQARWRFPDGPAHHMALRAMEQYALMLAALEPRLVPAASADELRAAVDGGRVPVWLPVTMVDGEAGITESWDVTSDSLSVWLARRIGAAEVVLVKSLPPPAEAADLHALRRSGCVDAAFPAFIRESGMRVWWCGPDDAGRLAQALTGAGAPGAAISAADLEPGVR